MNVKESIIIQNIIDESLQHNPFHKRKNELLEICKMLKLHITKSMNKIILDVREEMDE